MSGPLCVWQRVVQLAHRGDLHLAFWELSSLITTAAGPMCSPSNSKWGPVSSTPLSPFQQLLLVVSLILASLTVIKWRMMNNSGEGKNSYFYNCMGLLEQGMVTLKKDLIIHFSIFCISVCLNMSICMWVQVSTVARGGCQIPWSRNYSRLWCFTGVVLHRCGT